MTHRSLLVHEAFRSGTLQALYQALDDPTVVPNGPLPYDFGSCLVYAIYHSPVAFVRELLDLGADPKAEAPDGFPPLLAALSCAREHPGVPARTDALAVLRLLLERGADPQQRGINDYTALHMAVAIADAPAVRMLLAHGADPRCRTRVDASETPVEMAERAGLVVIADLLRAPAS